MLSDYGGKGSIGMGDMLEFHWEERQVVLHLGGDVCSTARDLMASTVFEYAVGRYCDQLLSHDSPLLGPFADQRGDNEDWHAITVLLRRLAEVPIDLAVEGGPISGALAGGARREALHEFVEGLYDYWRSFNRYLVMNSEVGGSEYEKRPYRSFNVSVERLAHMVRGLYRDVCENITGDHPRVYRQVAAGVNVGLIAVRRASGLPQPYKKLIEGIPLIRQIWMDPPVIIDPPMNKRTGHFARVDTNPLEKMELNPEDWLTFPVQVGPLVVFVCVHRMFIGLGCALCNLFELADDRQIESSPDAVYLFGAPPGGLSVYGELPTVFYDDEANDIMVAAVPAEERFGYFGYLKKMILTLHNIVMMKRGLMPYHGAMFRIELMSGAAANVLIIGDTATGKSESLEAFRRLGEEDIREIKIVADDMGSLEVVEGEGVVAYGTEIGAFVRLDDLQPGYAFDQIDRSVIMSPHRTNARVVLPVTTQEVVTRGYRVDVMLYANNYEEVDAARQVIERFEEAETALGVFREGRAMTKGTTTSTGMTRSYFANIFGPSQYEELHEDLAEWVFREAFASGVFVGQVRTRLGIEGYEAEGPLEAARALMRLITELYGGGQV